MLLAGVECGKAGFYLDAGAGAVLPAECLLGPFGESDAAEGGDEGWVEVVHCAVDVPAAETGEACVDVFFGGEVGVRIEGCGGTEFLFI